MIKNKKSHKNKVITSLLLGVLVLGGIILALELTNVTDFYKRKTANQDAWVDGINYGPPTEEEQQSGDDKKEEIVDQEENQPEPTQDANIVIVDASQYDSEIEVRAF